MDDDQQRKKYCSFTDSIIVQLNNSDIMTICDLLKFLDSAFIFIKYFKSPISFTVQPNGSNHWVMTGILNV